MLEFRAYFQMIVELSVTMLSLIKRLVVSETIYYYFNTIGCPRSLQRIKASRNKAWRLSELFTTIYVLLSIIRMTCKLVSRNRIESLVINRVYFEYRTSFEVTMTKVAFLVKALRVRGPLNLHRKRDIYILLPKNSFLFLRVLLLVRITKVQRTIR